MENIKIKEYVKKWMETHEPDTFIPNEHGQYIYTSKNGVSGLNLVCFFEDLLEDFINERKSKVEPSESNAILPDVIASNIKDIAKQAYEDIEKGIAWNFIEAKYLIDMKCNKDVEYNNKIIEEINTYFGENEYKLTPFFGLIFDE